jgi:hypothetical protein
MATTNELHPLRESAFRWSYFYDDTNFVPYDSEYPNAKAAESMHRFEDGQIAFDTDQEVRKMLFGIYASETEAGVLVFGADKWDKGRGDVSVNFPEPLFSFSLEIVILCSCRTFSISLSV